MPSNFANDPADQTADTDAGVRHSPVFDTEALAVYARRWPEESAVATEFAALLAEGELAFCRERLAGHFTASAWLVDAAGTHLLMTHHRKLDRWLQLGGHADGDTDLARAALREAQEESGLPGLSVERDIFDLDRHWIPERSEVPGHWHYDVRYVVHAGTDDAFAVSDESHALAWREIDALRVEAEIDPSIARMARKWVSQRARIEIETAGSSLHSE